MTHAASDAAASESAAASADAADAAEAAGGAERWPRLAARLLKSELSAEQARGWGGLAQALGGACRW